MDDAGNIWYFPAMVHKIPVWQLYGEDSPFPDLLHIEKIVDRAAGLDWQIAPHRHLHLHQIFLIQSGAVHLTVDGKTSPPEPPIVMNIPRGVVHGFRFAAGTEGYVLTLPAADFPELFGAEAETQAALQRAFVAPALPEIAAVFEEIAAQHGAQGPLRRLRLRAAAIGLCCTVAEGSSTQSPARDGGDPRVLRFEALIRSHLAQGWQLADYARSLAVSERHLRRLCLETTGLSAQSFIETIRLREACRLLAYTRMRVQEVGFALGFDDPAYFARVFRRGMGMTPGDYRARLEQ